jgi:hypothetical protein
MRKAATLSALLLAACSSGVYGPGVLVLPGTNRSFDQFRFDEQECRSYAQARLTNSGSEWDSAGSAQQRYDRAFLQCMYAKGHKVPVAGRYSDVQQEAAARTPPPPPAQPQAAPPAPPPPPAKPQAEAPAPPQAAVPAPPPPPPGPPPAEAPPDFRPQ